MKKWCDLLGRICLCIIFILAGYNKVIDYAATKVTMMSAGIPFTDMLLPLVILVELGGGIAILVGFQTRLVALALAAFCFLTAYYFHMNFADKMQMIMFLKNIAIAGGFLVLAAHGPGKLSLDRRHSND